jgi:hypothetical protein
VQAGAAMTQNFSALALKLAQNSLVVSLKCTSLSFNLKIRFYLSHFSSLFHNFSPKGNDINHTTFSLTVTESELTRRFIIFAASLMIRALF